MVMLMWRCEACRCPGAMLSMMLHPHACRLGLHAPNPVQTLNPPPLLLPFCCCCRRGLPLGVSVHQVRQCSSLALLTASVSDSFKHQTSTGWPTSRDSQHPSLAPSPPFLPGRLVCLLRGGGPPSSTHPTSFHFVSSCTFAPLPLPRFFPNPSLQPVTAQPLHCLPVSCS